jgi:hypothetical protein
VAVHVVCYGCQLPDVWQGPVQVACFVFFEGAGGHMPYGPGGSMRPHHLQGPPAAAAAAGGYGAPRGVPGPDRNVRPRHSGGGMPVGAAGPAAGQAGFKPGVLIHRHVMVSEAPGAEAAGQWRKQHWSMQCRWAFLHMGPCQPLASIQNQPVTGPDPECCKVVRPTSAGLLRTAVCVL